MSDCLFMDAPSKVGQVYNLKALRWSAYEASEPITQVEEQTNRLLAHQLDRKHRLVVVAVDTERQKPFYHTNHQIISPDEARVVSYLLQ